MQAEFERTLNVKSSFSSLTVKGCTAACFSERF
jgi:hypothetical protein